MNLTNYREDYVCLHHLIYGAFRSRNIMTTIAQHKEKYQNLKMPSDKLFLYEDNKIKELNISPTPSLAPHNSEIKKIKLNCRGELIVHYQIPCSITYQLLLNHKKFLYFTVEVKLKLQTFSPLAMQKNDLLVDLVFDIKQKEVLFLTKDKTHEKFQSDILHYEEQSIQLIRSEFLSGY